MDKQIISGDEAVARGAWEAGVRVAAAYPGTPSTEILENLSLFKDDVYVQWACNEKVAFEIAAGAAIGGVRSLAAMKHVGMNVAADPMFTLAYTGVNAGFVVVTADDPGCHSSQNEQDNRWYTLHAKCLMLEPSDSAECRDFTIAAFELSEKYDIPVILRMTTRVCHSKSLVQLGQRQAPPVKTYEGNAQKYAMLPANARPRHAYVEENLARLEEVSSSSPLNRVEWGTDTKIGVISSGISYMYAKDAFGPEASYLKLGFTNPMPKSLIRDFCSRVDKVCIVEEGDGFIEYAVKALGIECTGKDVVPRLGELDSQTVALAFGLAEKPQVYSADAAAPARPPVLCAGCPHRGFYFALRSRRAKIAPVGDIGCYSLGCLPPFNGFDAALCMGSGWSSTIGLAKALKAQNDERKVLGLLGDSTFFHSGITGLIDVVHSNSDVILCLLDNSITAMTGHQDHPGTSGNLMGETVTPVDPLAIIRATGLSDERIRIVDPIDQVQMGAALDEAIAASGPFVIICRRPCALLKPVMAANAGIRCVVNTEKCIGCRQCVKTACPSLTFENGKSVIYDPAGCTGCGLCMQQCRFGAIERIGG